MATFVYTRHTHWHMIASAVCRCCTVTALLCFAGAVQATGPCHVCCVWAYVCMCMGICACVFGHVRGLCSAYRSPGRSIMGSWVPGLCTMLCRPYRHLQASVCIHLFFTWSSIQLHTWEFAGYDNNSPAGHLHAADPCTLAEVALHQLAYTWCCTMTRCVPHACTCRGLHGCAGFAASFQPNASYGQERIHINNYEVNDVCGVPVKAYCGLCFCRCACMCVCVWCLLSYFHRTIAAWGYWIHRLAMHCVAVRPVD